MAVTPQAALLLGAAAESAKDIAGFIDKDQAAAQTALAAGYPQLSAQEIDLAFKQQWRNWTKPFFTVDDIRQELKLLKDLNERTGQTILMITHNPEAAAIADRILHMRDGVIVNETTQ